MVQCGKKPLPQMVTIFTLIELLAPLCQLLFEILSGMLKRLHARKLFSKLTVPACDLKIFNAWDYGHLDNNSNP
jgi:hypothetical protein